MFYVQPDLKYIEKTIQSFPNGKMETQCLTITLKNSELDILNIYIPPNAKLSVKEFLHYTKQLQRNYIICGDMNAHHQSWDSESNMNNNQAGKVIFKIIEQNII